MNKLLKACERPMIEAGKNRRGETLGSDAGNVFVETIFGGGESWRGLNSL